VAIGLSVHTAPVEIREKLAIAEADWPKAIAELCSYPHIEEAAVLSTCNRMEVYIVALSYHRGVREVEEFLARVRAPAARPQLRRPALLSTCSLRTQRRTRPHLARRQPARLTHALTLRPQRSGVPLEDLQKHLFLLRDRDATNHLLRVSAGLDSLVMGEGQILAQARHPRRRHAGRDARAAPRNGRRLSPWPALVEGSRRSSAAPRDATARALRRWARHARPSPPTLPGRSRRRSLTRARLDAHR